ncbi:fibrillarin-like rRNA/tRNA 2'-O-methyltransferase [Natrinema thermotolerans]
MSELPTGVQRREFDGTERLATQGEPVYGEPTDVQQTESAAAHQNSESSEDGEWRAWNPNRSKLGAMLELGMDTGLAGGETVLYLGAASGTTVSHVADFAGPTYAVEFAARPARDLLEAAESRDRLFPLLKDARKPESYAHVVESDVDVIVQDVATRGQARVALENQRFLADDGRLLLAVKARSEDVTREPAAVFEDVRAELEEGYEVVEAERLERYHTDHLGVVAKPL